MSALSVDQWITLPPGRGLGVDLTTALRTAGAVARTQIRRGVFRSQLSPEVAYDPNAVAPRTATSGGGLSEWIMSIVKPEIELDTTIGVLRTAPWGRPTRNYLPLVGVAAAVGAAVVIGLVVKGLRK